MNKTVFSRSVMSLVLAAVAALSITPTFANEDLEAAYRKEFAFLSEQKSNLEQRLVKFSNQQRQEQNALNSELDRLTQQLLFLESETERTNELVLESERAIETVRDNQNLFDTTFEQAKISYSDLNREFVDDDKANNDQRLTHLFTETLAVLDELDEVRTVSGSYFDKGEKIDGDILYLGRIAAYGLNPQHMGVLAPVGEGKMQVWEEPAPEVAKALAAGSALPTIKMFLYEHNSKGVDFDTEESIIDYIQSGGLIAWIIVILGAIGALLGLLRFVFLRMASVSTDKIIGAISPYVSSGDLPAALGSCEKCKGSTSRVITATLRNLDRDRDHLEDIISESILHESVILNRFGAFIIIIAAVSPLLGLLGTVTGMIATFDIITEFGTGDPKLLSGGISTALVTTQLGLVVAIPVLIMGNLLTGWSNRIKDEMEKGALKVVNMYDARTAATA